MAVEEQKELEEVYDDGQGRPYDIIDEELASPQDKED